MDDFLQALLTYDKEHIPESSLSVVKQEYLRIPEFHPDHVRTKSYAAAGLCAWAINIVRYYEVRENVTNETKKTQKYLKYKYNIMHIYAYIIQFEVFKLN